MRPIGTPSLLCATLLLTTPPLYTQTAAPHAATSAWHVAYEENFEGPAPFPAAPAWAPDTHQLDDQFSDGGSHFPGVTPPTAFRIEAPFSKAGWLTAAAYTRSDKTAFSNLFAVGLRPEHITPP